MKANTRIISAVVTSVALAVGQLSLSVIPANAALVSLTPMVTKDLTTPGYSALTLAQDLMGSGVKSVSNATYKGASAQLGTIDIADPAVVSFNHGVILSSGNIADIVGPNKSESTTGDMSTWPGNTPGASDSDLTSLISNTQTVNPMTYDSASLEFDFVPTSNDIYFTYVFGSDEYLEWVNLYNDVFGFWVTNGSGQKANCAVNKDGNPVSIDTINSTVDPSEYRDNSFINPPANPINIESDGLTVEMICHASVTANAVNHIKLAIADTSDQVLDSQVILKASSLSTTKPESCNNGVDDNNNGSTDMNDPYCQATTTPAPPGIVNPTVNPSTPTPPVGPTYTGSPFTGTEGTPVWLDANALNWNLGSGIASTSWQVYVNGNTALQCDVYNPDGTPQTHQALNPDGSYALAYAICPTDGKYTARIDGWDVDGQSANDMDVDFNVANAPPSIDYVNLSNFTSVDKGTPLTVDAYVSDVPSDTITCQFDFGDGQKATATPDSTGLCSATSTYAKAGDFMLQVKAVDNQKDASAFLSVTTVSNPFGLSPQSITVTKAAPASAAYGNTFTVAATADSGLPVVVTTSGNCSVSGYSVTMTAATGSCSVMFDQAGDGVNYDAAATVTETVTATTRPITVTADAKTKVWGSTDPALTYTVTTGSLVPGDSLSGSLTRAVGENLGNYAISKGTIANSKYAITYVGANLTITGVAPAITSGPSSVTGAAGTAVSFTSAGTGKPTPTIQWQAMPAGGAWANIAGATSANYSYTIATGDSGKQFRAVYTNGVGSATSVAASVSIPGVPTITSITPTSGGVGTSVTITGTNLSGATAVKFAGTTTSAVFTVLSATSIVTSVPVGAVTGGIAVTTPGGSATSASFKPATTLVVPTVTAYSSSSTRAGTAATVTVTGTNLGGATSVTIGGVSLQFTVKAATSLQVQIPSTLATGGPIRVVTAGGTSVNTIAFSVLSLPTQLTAGASHSCAIITGGTVKCWGLNSNGQLGNGTTAQSTSPALVSGISGAKQVSAGAAFTCATLTDGSAWCWGLNTNGQLGDGTANQSTTAVRVKATLTTNLTGVAGVATGGAFACALMTDTTVRCWGLGTSGQLGNGALLSSSLPVTVSGLTGVTAITAGGTTACAILTSGAVKCWGANNNGQLGNGSTAKNSSIPVQVTGIDGTTAAAKATAIDAGDNQVCAVVAGGAQCWGLNSNGQLGDGTTTKRTTPVSVLASAGVSLSGVTAITSGASHSCAILGSGSTATAVCWGINTNGGLGNASTVQSLFPVDVLATNTTGITQIVAGGAFTLGLTPSVALAPTGAAAWGKNSNGQLGDATTTAKSSPVALLTL